jgi:AcrR family transcriptional regulator
MRQLTHRAVDAAANVPPGSTSNRFRTRDSLLVGVLRRILERESVMWTRLAIDIHTPTVDGVADAIGRLIEELTDTGRVLSQARRTIFVEATNQPVLGAEIADLQHEISDWMAPLLSELGSTDPARDVRHLLALMDGLVINQLTSPRRDFDPTRAVTALLQGLTER